MNWIIQKYKNTMHRIRNSRRSRSYEIFLGVFWALVAYRLLEIFTPIL